DRDLDGSRRRVEVTVRTPTFSVEVITLSVSDVERALRFYVNQAGCTLEVHYSPNESFRAVQLTPPCSSCSLQIAKRRTGAPVGSLRNDYLVVMHLEAERSRPLERSVEVGEIRHKTPSEPGTEVLHPDSTPRAETMPAFPIRMATAGYCKNAATAMCDVVWKLVDVEHAWRTRSKRQSLFANVFCLQEEFRARWLDCYR